MSEIIWGRYSLFFYTAIFSVITFIFSIFYYFIFIFFLPIFTLLCIALYDFFQKKRSILSNFPLLGRFRFFLESINVFKN